MISRCIHAVIVTEDANYPSPQSESSSTRTTCGLRRAQRVFDNGGGPRRVASGKGEGPKRRHHHGRANLRSGTKRYSGGTKEGGGDRRPVERRDRGRGTRVGGLRPSDRRPTGEHRDCDS